MFWKAMYNSGSIVKCIADGVEDFIKYYFNEFDYKIHIVYEDDRHKQIKEFIAEDNTGKQIGTYKNMRDAQFKISNLVKDYYS